MRKMGITYLLICTGKNTMLFMLFPLKMHLSLKPLRRKQQTNPN